jgi:uncharacterized Zn finger protein
LPSAGDAQARSALVLRKATIVPREGAEAKGRRYLTEGRLVVDRVSGSEIRARCRGAGALYVLGCEGGRWHCSCPALTTCAHLHALMLVTTNEPCL